MALQTIPGGLWLPPRPSHLGVALSFSGILLIDAANEKAAAILQVRKAGTVSKISWGTRTVTTGATLDVRLETVDLATGNPSGTLLAAGSNASVVVADADDNVRFTSTLTTPVAVTRGQKVAVVIVNPAVSPGNFQISSIENTTIAGETPYITQFTPSWFKNTQAPAVALEYDDGSYDVAPGCFPMSAVASVVYANSSTPDERGLKFKVPFPCRAVGAWIWANLSGDFDIALYDSDGTTVMASYPGDLNVGVVFDYNRNLFLFTGTASLLKDTFYRLVLKPTTATVLGLIEFTVGAAAVMDAFEGGQNFHLTTRTDAGAWTDTTTQRPMMGLILDQFDDGVGGGAAGGFIIGA